MSESAADGADSAPMIADSDGALLADTWPFDHGVALDDDVEANLLALADEGLPIDMLMATSDLVQVERGHDEPFFNDDEIGDWSGTAYDAPRLLTLGGQTYDLVIGGSYAENVHMLPDHPAFAGWGETAALQAASHDLLVSLGPSALDGEPTGLAPFGGAIATSSESGIWGGAIVADLQSSELSWLAGVDGPGGHVGEAWAWDSGKSAYVFHHFV
jgi:hypothetical protein